MCARLRVRKKARATTDNIHEVVTARMKCTKQMVGGLTRQARRDTLSSSPYPAPALQMLQPKPRARRAVRAPLACARLKRSRQGSSKELGRRMRGTLQAAVHATGRLRH